MSASDLSLINELVTLRRENTRLRRRQLGDAAERQAAWTRHIVERTYRDAQLLVGEHFSWQSIDKRSAPLSEHRWTMAVAMLRLARLVPQVGHVRMKCTSPAVAATRLETAYRTAMQEPGALAARMQKSRRNGAIRWT